MNQRRGGLRCVDHLYIRQMHTRAFSWLICVCLWGCIACQPVSVNDSFVYGHAVTSSQWVAGEAVMLYIQLRDVQQTNISTAIDGLLRVSCSTDPSAPADASFCLDPPWVTPYGNGLFTASLTVGTIWGTQLTSGAVAQGDNVVNITYAGRHLPGSPLRRVLLPEPIISRYHTYIGQLVQGVQATTGLVVIGSIMQVADRFTNWNREVSLPSNFTWSFVDAATAVGDVQSSVAWRFDLASIQLWARNLTKAGLYTYAVKYTDPSGLYDTIFAFDNGVFTDVGRVAVRPRQLSNMEVIPSGRHVAGTNYWYTFSFTDDFGNAAVLIKPYMAWRTPFYCSSDQSLSLVQVDLQPMNCTRCMVPNTTTGLDPDCVGTVKLGIYTTVAGWYMISISCYVTQVPLKWTVTHEVLSTGHPHPNTSFVALSSTSVVAGTSPAYQVHMYDEYSNHIPVEALAPQSDIFLHVDRPNNTSTIYKVDSNFDVKNIIDTVAGTHSVTLAVGNTTGALLSYNVSPSPATSPYFSTVSGTGMGVITPGVQSSTPYIYAGVYYYVDAYGYDTWNNAQIGFAAICASMNDTEHNDLGKTTVNYMITKAGEYTLDIQTRDEELIHTQPLRVLPHPYINQMIVNKSLPDALHAGQVLDIHIVLLDRFQNVITPEACYLELKGGAWTTTMTVLPANKGDSRQRFSMAIASVGIYNITFVATGASNSRHALPSLTVIPDIAQPRHSFITGPSHLLAESIIDLQLHMRDNFGNPVPAQLENAQAVEVVIVPTCQCVLRVYLADAGLKISTTLPVPGAYQIYISLNKEPVRSFPYQVSVVSTNAILPTHGNTTQGRAYNEWNDCSSHGIWADGYCLCDVGWVTDTQRWVDGNVSWCNSMFAERLSANSGGQVNIVLVVLLVACSFALIGSAVLTLTNCNNQQREGKRHNQCVRPGYS